MDPLLSILANLGLGIAGNAIYDSIKALASKPASREELLHDIQNSLDLEGVHMHADDVISALVMEGCLRIDDSQIYAGNTLVFGASGGRATLCNNSSLRTNRTEIFVQGDGMAKATGHSQIRLEGGNITFHVGQPISDASGKTPR
jgi:hypothetical protein